MARRCSGVFAKHFSYDCCNNLFFIQVKKMGSLMGPVRPAIGEIHYFPVQQTWIKPIE